MIELVCGFRSQGVQWPLRPGDVVLVWDGMDLLGEIAAQLVIDLIAHHLYGLKLQERLRVTVQPPRKALAKAPAPVALQEQRRAQRRQNSAHRRQA